MLPLSPPKGAQEQKVTGFCLKTKSALSRRKSAAKFLYVKSFSSEAVSHSLAYLTVHKWLVVHVPFYLKFFAKMTQTQQKWRLPINIASSTTTATVSEKSSNITNRKPTKRCPMSLR